ncbi:MAG: tRNA lysidine(34) synthetase TilS [Bacilli bacterium]|nr:tRNA lysidine(34) synthetase TilS [Bacilli bacterium]
MNTKYLNVINDMLSILDNKSVLVAVSTGVDSTVLLDLVLKIKTIKKVVVAHVNHQKRIQSNDEERYIKTFCEKNNISCYSIKLPKDHTGNFQEWARNARYDFFNELMQKEKLQVLLTAHHADDNLETILMRFIKGSSLKGYAGISKMITEKGYNIYRPLLNLSKEDILTYAKENNLKYFEDASNKEDDYTRNRIRKYIVPLLLKENPALYQAVSNYSDTLFEASNILEEKIKKFITSNVIYDNNIISFKLDHFNNETEFIQTEILFSLLKPYELSTSCIKEILKKINASKTKIVSDINNDLVFIKEYGTINFIPKKEIPGEFYLKITKPGTYQLPNNKVLIVDKNKCYLNPSKDEMWYNIPELPFIVRTRKDGDTIKLPGGTKTISNYLTDKKISQVERMKILLICDGNNKPIYMIK